MTAPIPYSTPTITGNETQYIEESLREKSWLRGSNSYLGICRNFFEQHQGKGKAYLTNSCTSALQMAAMVLRAGAGDEIIMPSFTFVSTANSFVMHGATPVFVDIDPNTMNLRADAIEAAITDKTKAIVVVHYAGVACDMEAILAIAQAHNLTVIEDAAQGLDAYYHDAPLGTFGDMATFSLHYTKNINCFEGGVLMVNRPEFQETADIIYRKGTNMDAFLKGQIPAYSWIDVGASYEMSEISAAFLWAQLEQLSPVTEARLAAWQHYYDALQPLAEQGYITLPHVPEACRHNAHIFYIKVKDKDERTALMAHLHDHHQVQTSFHYVPLHGSPGGQRYARFAGDDQHTTRESERLLRLPLFYGITEQDTVRVAEGIRSFYEA